MKTCNIHTRFSPYWQMTKGFYIPGTTYIKVQGDQSCRRWLFPNTEKDVKRTECHARPTLLDFHTCNNRQLNKGRRNPRQYWQVKGLDLSPRRKAGLIGISSTNSVSASSLQLSGMSSAFRWTPSAMMGLPEARGADGPSQHSPRSGHKPPPPVPFLS